MGDEYDQTTLYGIPKELIKNREKNVQKAGKRGIGNGNRGMKQKI